MTGVQIFLLVIGTTCLMIVAYWAGFTGIKCFLNRKFRK